MKLRLSVLLLCIVMVISLVAGCSKPAERSGSYANTGGRTHRQKLQSILNYNGSDGSTLGNCRQRLPKSGC